MQMQHQEGDECVSWACCNSLHPSRSLTRQKRERDNEEAMPRDTS